jgi:hypothetical protein
MENTLTREDPVGMSKYSDSLSDLVLGMSNSYAV